MIRLYSVNILDHKQNKENYSLTLTFVHSTFIIKYYINIIKNITIK